ncbi:MAG: fucose isomerase [Synergistaceae bacterium]|nr:fucose isomerase [Synergistaceae bacterium]
MLKGIPDILSGDLLKVLADMGHGDKIVISDGNFPSSSMGKNGVVIRCNGHGVPEILDAVLSLFPLDTFVDKPVTLMKVVPGQEVETPIWDTYEQIISKYDERGKNAIQFVERFDFYEESKKSYAIIATSESALYACMILQKGVIKP